MLQVTALYSNVDKTTRYRDFRKMIELKLIKFEQSPLNEKEQAEFIFPNFQKLEELEYA